MLFIHLLQFADVSLSDASSKTKIDFDSLALVRNSMGANQLHDVILKSIDRNISIVESAVTNKERPLSTFVFYPNAIGHFISYVYPTSSSDDGNVVIIFAYYFEIFLVIYSEFISFKQTTTRLLNVNKITLI